MHVHAYAHAHMETLLRPRIARGHASGVLRKCGQEASVFTLQTLYTRAFESAHLHSVLGPGRDSGEILLSKMKRAIFWGAARAFLFMLNVV